DRPIKLFPGKDKRTLIIKNVQGSNVPLQELWQQGWISCQLFVASLNIGTHGIFYWNTVTDIDKYYDYITDLESKKRIEIRLETQLTLNWKSEKLYLTEENLELAFITYEYLIQVGNIEESELVINYLSGLGMLAKTDIHLRLETSAFNLFQEAFYQAILLHEKPIPEANIWDTGYFQIEGMLKGKDEFDRTAKLANQLRQNIALSEPITLKEVIGMKRYCEIYFL